MNNLFSVFDPQVRWAGLSLNWSRLFLVVFWIPGLFWPGKSQFLFLFRKIVSSLAGEFKNNFSPVCTPGHTHWAIGIFLLILINNLGGLTPYTFTGTSHLSVSVRLALVGWVSYVVSRCAHDSGRFLAHLVPAGTPYILIPFMVLIELIRTTIRPLTLSVRLAANIVAGHLLIRLVRGPLVFIGPPIMGLVMRGLVLLIILESAVAFIQAYVFRILRTLYLREANRVKLHYLCNVFPYYPKLF